MVNIRRHLARLLPIGIKRQIIKVVSITRASQRRQAEFEFWEEWVREHGTAPETDYYRKFMLDMGNLKDVSFFDGKICVDIGCGPRGSLTWLSNAKAAIGLDPLSESYARLGIEKHSMLYLACAAERMPFPSGYVDVVFSMNSLDHVDNLPAACREIRRVLKPGGHFIGSLNLDEPPTVTEPWTLTEELLEQQLFRGWEAQYREIRPKVHSLERFGPYKYFYEPCPAEALETGKTRAMWCRYRVPGPK
jgi:ubiquinone/menaquinone biosynthesis C-methylase UbiE